jgi:hypothetical protein
MLRVLRPLAWLFLILLLAGCTPSVRIDWSTESEINTAGFNLYRSVSPDGPFDVKINPQLIPPASDPLVGGKYTFEDKTARPGVTYYYQLEEIEKSGAVNLHGPVASRASAFDGPRALVLGGLAGLVIFLWVRAGRQRAAKH